MTTIEESTSQSLATDVLLYTLPYAVAEAFRWLCWGEAWYTAVGAAASGAESPLDWDEGECANGLPHPSTLDPATRLEWLDAWRSSFSAACEAFGCRQLKKPLSDAAAAAARHATARTVGIAPGSEPPSAKRLDTAKAEWVRFQSAVEKLGTYLHAGLQESIRRLMWHGAWHAASLVQQGLVTDTSDEEDELDADAASAAFGEGYPGLERDALSNLAHFLCHIVECHKGEKSQRTSWRGLCLPASSTEADVKAAATAGFNTIRLMVPTAAVEDVNLESSQAALLHIRAVIAVCAENRIKMVLDLTNWPLAAKSINAICPLLLSLVTELKECDETIAGVALPRLNLQHVAPLVVTLRSAGLSAGTCAVIVPLTDDPVDDFGEYSGVLRHALAEGERGVMLADGHVVLEARRGPPDGAKIPRDLLTGASYGGSLTRELPARLVLEVLPLSCVNWDLRVPSRLAADCKNLGPKFWEEMAARHGAAASMNTTHGWFSTLDAAPDFFNDCLRRKWSWPAQPCSIIWPLDGAHMATLVYLHDMGGTGEDYMCYPEFFSRETIFKRKGKVEELLYVPFPGAKVVLPTAARLLGLETAAGWCDFDASDLQEKSLDKATLELHKILDQEAAALGGSGCLLLGGAGQGGCMALHAGLSWSGTLSGVFVAHGHILRQTTIPSQVPTIRVYHSQFSGVTSDNSDTWAILQSVEGDVKAISDDGAEWDEEVEGRLIRDFLLEMWKRWHV